MKLIVMTQATFFVEEDKILTTLFEEGLDMLHLYKPQSEPILCERLLSLIPDDYHKRIMVHDHFYLKEEYKLRGIHLNQYTDQPPADYRGSLSCTCRSIGHLKEAKRRADYVFLKSLFDSLTSKADKQSLDIDEVESAARNGLVDRKVFAMGGISLDNIAIVRELGFGGAVVCGDLWNRFNIHNQTDFKCLIDHFHKLRKAVG